MTSTTSLQRTLLFWLGSLSFLIVGFISSCSKDSTDSPLELKIPANFPPLKYNLAGNTLTQNKFILGRTLFYDPILSRNNTISCGNCHQKGAAFCHPDHAVSHGIDDKNGTRNSPALQNLGFYATFMWDGGIFDLDLQPLAPIENHVEMDGSIEDIMVKLNQSSKYKTLFRKAYGSEEINSYKMLKALSQFLLMLVSADSKYDKYVQGEPGGDFSADEKEGLALFNVHCRVCHATDLFTDQSFRNNGLPPTLTDDLGRYLVTLNEADKYKFKVPGLRNVAITAPYMHDGRFRTLEAVMDHYQSGVRQSPTLDPLLVQGTATGIPLTEDEKKKIILFLKTLTDENFIKDKRFAEQ